MMTEEKSGEKTRLLGSNGMYGSVDSQSGSHSHQSSGNHRGNGFNRSKLEFTTSVVSANLSCHNINYVIKVKENKQKVDKYILKDINGLFTPGMNAILGPTGSGKTSLLDVLAARKDPNGLQGVVLIDGQSQPADFKLISGYVVQDDVVMGTLTVRENLAFSAALRLSGDVSSKEKAERVDEVITELGLKSCADTKVGDAFSRGVSGGERKRTNIGMELIIKPSILFLDEPTTGLDASTANAVMLLLSRLSHRGRTIIFSIHQPRYSIYRVFDKLHLLSGGETVYHGPADQALEHFANNGFICEEHNNPPDFFLDVLNEDSSAVQNVTDLAHEAQEEMEKGTQDESVKPKEQSHLKSSLVEQYKNSHLYEDAHKHLNDVYNNYQGTEEPVIHQAIYPTSSFIQYIYLCYRNARNVLRNPRVSSGQLLVTTFFALIVGGIYFDLDESATAGIQNRVGAFFFIAMNMIFGNTSAVEPFIAERIIFIHESASGFYRVSAYFFAKITADLFPLRFIPTAVFAVISYWMIGFKPDAISFFIYLLNLLTTTFAACGLAFIIGASTRVIGLANLFIAMCYVFMMIFGGLLVNIASLPEWLQYVQYISIVRYSMNTLYINELRDRTFCDPPTNNGTFQYCLDGNDYLESQGIGTTDWDLWQNQVALAVITVFLMFLTYVQLRRMPKLK
ncbi:broad substrate specificity ATP-binding cassette transporter ABCG2-like isoform X2 [Amphiura filiformis]|uniref:broad substrate specificity ATP-binding cassette transporter ABCG2-like isoform X2 n=1 Tax=Amphiura filiformis TaxID=82378 RepID=UPI003B215AE5